MKLETTAKAIASTLKIKRKDAVDLIRKHLTDAYNQGREAKAAEIRAALNVQEGE